MKRRSYTKGILNRILVFIMILSMTMVHMAPAMPAFAAEAISEESGSGKEEKDNASDKDTDSDHSEKSESSDKEEKSESSDKEEKSESSDKEEKSESGSESEKSESTGNEESSEKSEDTGNSEASESTDKESASSEAQGSTGSENSEEKESVETDNEKSEADSSDNSNTENNETREASAPETSGNEAPAENTADNGNEAAESHDNSDKNESSENAVTGGVNAATETGSTSEEKAPVAVSSQEEHHEAAGNENNTAKAESHSEKDSEEHTAEHTVSNTEATANNSNTVNTIDNTENSTGTPAAPEAAAPAGNVTTTADGSANVIAAPGAESALKANAGPGPIEEKTEAPAAEENTEVQAEATETREAPAQAAEPKAVEEKKETNTAAEVKKAEAEENTENTKAETEVKAEAAPVEEKTETAPVIEKKAAATKMMLSAPLANPTAVEEPEDKNVYLVLHFSNIINANGTVEDKVLTQTLGPGTGWTFTQKKFDNQIVSKSFDYNDQHYVYSGSWVDENGETVTKFSASNKNFAPGSTNEFYFTPVYDMSAIRHLKLQHIDNVSTGTGSWSNQNSFSTYTKTFKAPANKSDYQFVEWRNETEIGDYKVGDTFNQGDKMKISSDMLPEDGELKEVTLYAYWQPSVTVNFNEFGTTKSYQKSFEGVDAGQVDPKNDPEHYRFIGWGDEDGNILIGEDAVIEAPEVTKENGTAVKTSVDAYWQPSITVNYMDAKNGSVITIDDETATTEEYDNISVSDNSAAKAAQKYIEETILGSNNTLKFLGWFVKNDNEAAEETAEEADAAEMEAEAETEEISAPAARKLMAIEDPEVPLAAEVDINELKNGQEVTGNVFTKLAATKDRVVQSIVNLYARFATSFNVSKTWEDEENRDGKRPESIQVQLLANGSEQGDPITLTKDGGWKYTFENLEAFDDNGDLIRYSLKELAVEGYTAEITESRIESENKKNNGLLEEVNITNIHEPEKIEFTITKTWDDEENKDGIRPESIEVSILADGEVVDTVEITSEDDWAKLVSDMYRYTEGKEIEYTVAEAKVEGYEESITGSAAEGFGIANYHKPAEEPKEEPKDEPKPTEEPKEEPKPEVKPETTPEEEPEVKPETTPEVKPETDPETAPKAEETQKEEVKPVEAPKAEETEKTTYIPRRNSSERSDNSSDIITYTASPAAAPAVLIAGNGEAAVESGVLGASREAANEPAAAEANEESSVLGANREAAEQEVLGAARLPQTGALWWPIPILLILGFTLIGGGIYSRREREEA